MTKDYYPSVAFSTGPIGYLLQLNDRIAVTDPMSGVELLYRIISKGWSQKFRMKFRAVRDGHWSSVLDEVFLKTGDAWASSEVAL